MMSSSICLPIHFLIQFGYEVILSLVKAGGKEKDQGEESLAKLGPFLPIGIISEILSRLPAKNVIRCKCVCKEWHGLIESRSFVAKHFGFSRCVDVICDDFNEILDLNGTIIQEKFKTMRVFAGLVAEKGDISRKYRLRNLTTQEIVYLPDPHQNTYALYASDSNFLSSGEIKLVATYSEKDNQGFEYLNWNRDDRWRPVKLSILEKPKRSSQGKVFLYKNIFHNVEQINDGSKVYFNAYSFDTESLCCFSNSLPQGFFSDLSKVSALIWNGCLAFGDIEEEKLNVVVLEDYKKPKWSRTQINFPLTYLKAYPHMKKLVPSGIYKDNMWFYPHHDGRRFCYNTRSKKVTGTYYYGFNKRYAIYPNIVTFKRNAIGEDTQRKSSDSQDRIKDDTVVKNFGPEHHGQVNLQIQSSDRGNELESHVSTQSQQIAEKGQETSALLLKQSQQGENKGKSDETVKSYIYTSQSQEEGRTTQVSAKQETRKC